MSYMVQIFISYARTDGGKLATRLAADLRTCGFGVWLDNQQIKIGARWTMEIERAIDDAHVFVAILTAGSSISEMCRAEQLRAVQRKKKVISLIAQRGADVPIHLGGIQHLDFADTSHYTRLLQDLIQAIRESQTPGDIGNSAKGSRRRLAQLLRQSSTTLKTLTLRLIALTSAIAGLVFVWPDASRITEGFGWHRRLALPTNAKSDIYYSRGAVPTIAWYRWPKPAGEAVPVLKGCAYAYRTPGILLLGLDSCSRKSYLDHPGHHMGLAMVGSFIPSPGALGVLGTCRARQETRLSRDKPP